MTKPHQPKLTTLRVSRETLKRLHRLLADLIAQTGNTKMALGDVVEKLLDEREKIQKPPR